MTDFRGGFAVVGEKKIGRQIWGMWDSEKKTATPVGSVERATILVRRVSLAEVLDADLYIQSAAEQADATPAQIQKVVQNTASKSKEFVDRMMPIIAKAQPRMVPTILAAAEDIFRCAAAKNIDGFSAAVDDFAEKLSSSVASIDWSGEDEKQAMVELIMDALIDEPRKVLGAMRFNPKHFIRGTRGEVGRAAEIPPGVAIAEMPEVPPQERGIVASPVWWDVQPFQLPKPIGIGELLGLGADGDEFFHIEFDPRLRPVTEFVRRKASRIATYPNPLTFPVNINEPAGVRFGFMVFAPFLGTVLDGVREFIESHRGAGKKPLPDYQVIFPMPRVDRDLRGESRENRSTMELLEATAREDMGDPMPIPQYEIEGYPPPARPVSVLELALMPVRPFNFELFRALAWRKSTSVTVSSRALTAKEGDTFDRMQRIMGGNNVRMMELCFGTSRRARLFKGKEAAGDFQEKFPPANLFGAVFQAMQMAVVESAEPNGVKTRYKAVPIRASGNLAVMREYHAGMVGVIERKADRERRAEITAAFAKHRGRKR